MTDEAIVAEFAEKISKRNPGGLDVFFRLIDHLGELAVFDFAQLQQMNVLGSDLYTLFAYCCDRDIAKVHQAIAQNTAIEQLRLIPGSTFWQAQQKESE